MLKIFILIILIDQLLKTILPIWGIQVTRNPDLILGLVLVPNLFSAAISLILLLAVAVHLWTIKSNKKSSDMIQWALVLFISGGAGNLLDKLQYGYVRDYINFWIVPVFNFADGAITLAVVLYGYQLIKSCHYFRRS